MVSMLTSLSFDSSPIGRFSAREDVMTGMKLSLILLSLQDAWSGYDDQPGNRSRNARSDRFIDPEGGACLYRRNFSSAGRGIVLCGAIRALRARGEWCLDQQLDGARTLSTCFRRGGVRLPRLWILSRLPQA